MNVLSLFDGISCGRLALERAGIKVNNYYASEIDKWAMQISKKNYPDIWQLGKAEEIHINSYGFDLVGIGKLCVDAPIPDLLIGGSPCQGFSNAGNGENFSDPRSKLFFEFIRILNEIREFNPDVKFLLENVKMKKEWKDIITKYIGVEPIIINSNLLSAQNRERYYWTNIEGITQPEDKNIFMESILLNKHEFAVNFDNRGKNPRLLYKVKKAGTLVKNYNKGLDNHGNRTAVFYLNEKELERANYNYKSKIWSSGNRMGNMKFPDSKEKKARCLTKTVIKGARETIHIQDYKGIRILTPVEFERLQTLPDNYTLGISNTQRYATVGNGWTVDVIAHILSFLK